MPYFIPSVYNIGEYEEITIEQIVKKLKTAYIDMVIKIRNAHPKEQARLKSSLPAFSLCEFEYGKLIGENLKGTKYIIYDIDGIDQQKIANLKTAFKGFALFWFTSSRGKGLKFVIEMEGFIPAKFYRQNWQHYYNYFRDTLEVDIDKAYQSYQTWFSHDADVCLNPERKLFPVIQIEQERKANDVDLGTIAPAELDHVVEYIGDKCELHYDEWLKVGLALKSISKSTRFSDGYGLKLWLRLEQIDKNKHQDHQHRRYRDKWDALNPKEITIGTLFYVAYGCGYERAQQYTDENRSGYKCPFVQHEDGLYNVTKVKNKYVETLVFSFRDIKVLHSIIGKEAHRSRVAVSVDGIEVEIPTNSFASPGAFCKNLLEAVGFYFHMTPTSTTAVYQKLFAWIAKTQSQIRLIDAGGMGNVAPGIWNMGNVIITDTGVFPYQPIVYSEKVGYAMERDPGELCQIHIVSDRKFWDMLVRLYEFYDEWAALAIGWCVSNIFFEKIIKEKAGFPLFYAHGQSQSGKTQLALLMLSMCGVSSPDGGEYAFNLSKATVEGANRVKAKSIGIPHLIDEYVANNTSHFYMLKATFHATKSVKAQYTNNLKTRQVPIRSGSILTSCARPTQEEAVNRCVYADLDGLSRRKDSKAFNDEFEGGNRNYLSALIMIAITRLDYPTWDKFFRQAYDEINMPNTDSRVLKSYATVMAGYYAFMDIIKDKKVYQDIPKIGIDWWRTQVTRVKTYIAVADPGEMFLNAIMGLGNPNMLPWLSIEHTEVQEVNYIEVTFNLVQALEYLKDHDKTKTWPALGELKKSLESKKQYFVQVGSRRIKDAKMNCHSFMIPDAGAINDVPTETNYNEVPF